ncbi:MAG: phenylalanine--tRNA ligase subunit beta [Halieaceae bacterium]|nr:phenylalanine--tRNA ligase subunit beta [Halieaceae bacterium]
MKISEQWIRQWVEPGLSSAELAQLLTMAGLEVTTVEAAAGDFRGVVVAEIVAAAAHPGADKLRVCQVNTGSETVQVVCGADNARVGLKAPLARVGAELPGDFRIEQRTLRGEQSRGMLCSEPELGLSASGDGLMELAEDAPLGEDLRSYLDLDDQVINLELTPNRADCLGLRGIAREVGVLTRKKFSEPEFNPVKPSVDVSFPVKLENPEACPRYLGRIIKGVDVSRPSPAWMRERLRRSGLRSIDAVVDVTNYVMMELGQPMHAFDLDKLREGIVVRKARDDESLLLLDGRSVSLNTDTLLISDAAGPLAVAGIMGGADSAVSESTTDLMLEAAFFSPLALAGQARSYGLATESGHRFERGVDYDLQRRAMERASQLLIDIVGGDAGPITEAVAEDQLPTVKPIALRRERIPRLLGFTLENEEVERILEGLGLLLNTTGSGWRAKVPSWRFDINIEVDLLEELVRIHGYDNLPLRRLRSVQYIKARPEQTLCIRQLRLHLANRDYREAVTYSFIDPAAQALFDPEITPLQVRNPISKELSVMRSSMLPGLVNALRYNVNRQRYRVRLFESGLCFLPGAEGLEQRPFLAAVITGRRLPESWAEQGEQFDFFDAKGDLESLLALADDSAAFRFEPAQRTGLHPGQTAAVWRGEKFLGHVGALHPACQAHYGLGAPVYLFELDLEVLRDRVLPEFRELSRFPEIRRDLAVSVDETVNAAEIVKNIQDISVAYLTNIMLFDMYKGKGIDPKRKSLAFGLTFGDSSRTLSDQDIAKSVDQVIDFLQKTYHAELRE